MKQKHNKGVAIHVDWVLEKSDLPSGMKFEPDSKKKGHYLLTITEKMPLHRLVSKLKWIADQMSVIKDAGRAL